MLGLFEFSPFSLPRHLTDPYRFAAQSGYDVAVNKYKISVILAAFGIITGAAAHPHSPRLQPSHALSPLERILLRHRTAAGKTVVGTKGRRTEYSVQAAAITGSIVEYDVPPVRSLIEFKLGPITQIQGRSPRGSWQKDSTGTVRIVHGAELAEDQSLDSFSLEHAQPDALGHYNGISLLPGLDPTTHDFRILVLLSPTVSQTVFISPVTFLVDKIELHKSGLEMDVTFHDYKRVEGEEVPDSIEMGYAGLPFTIHAKLVSCQLNLKLTSAMFDPPSSPTDYSFVSSPTGTSATIPFKLVKNEIVIPADINGTRVHLMLDSGSGGSFITEGLAKTLGLPLQNGLPAMGYGGSAQTSIAARAQITLPHAVAIKDQLLYVVNGKAATKSLKNTIGVEGALGYDFFERFVVTVDYATQRLTISKPSEPSAVNMRDLSRSIPISLSLHVPVIRATIDGVNGLFMLDTGDSGSVHLYSRFAKRIALARFGKSRSAPAQGVGGGVTEHVTMGHTLKLGSYNLQDVEASEIRGSGISEVSDLAGGIGNNILKQFTLRYDYSRGIVMLSTPSSTPNDATKPEPAALAGSTDSSPHVPDRITLQDLLARHINALGGREAIKHIVITRITAYIYTGGATGTAITAFQYPNKEFEEDKISSVDVLQGFSGQKGWRRGPSGELRALSPDEISDVVNQLYFDTGSYAFGAPMHGTVTLGPTENGDYTLDVVPDGGKSSVVTINHATYLIESEQHMEDNVPVTTVFSDYRTVDGVLFPFAQHVSNGRSRYDISIKVQKVEDNVTLDSGLFTEPAPPAEIKFEDPRKVNVTLPITISDNAIVVSAHINGEPAKLILDTGAAGLAINKAFADSSGLKQGGILEANGYGGSTDFRPAVIHDLYVSNTLHLHDVSSAVISFPDALLKGMPHDVVGFIGYDLLSKFVTQFNINSRNIELIEPRSFVGGYVYGRAIDLQLDDDVPSIMAKIDGSPVRLLIDSGDPSHLRLYSPFEQSHHELRVDSKNQLVGGGIGGLSRSESTVVPSLSIAGKVFRNVPSEVTVEKDGDNSLRYGGAIGEELMAEMTMTLDYPDQKAYIKQNSPDTIDRRVDTGVSVALAINRGNRGIYIRALSGPAGSSNKLSITEEIIKIGATRVSKFTFSSVTERLKHWPANKDLVLSVRDAGGSIHIVTVPTLTLERY